MTDLLRFISTHSYGIFILIFSMAAVIFFIQWISWIFSLGRFAASAARNFSRESSLRFIFADLIVKIINDFRHLLALIIVLIFALALGYALIKDGVKSINIIVSSLGGLIGSIIGYYFGESSSISRRMFEKDKFDKFKKEATEQDDESTEKEPITRVPSPDEIKEIKKEE